MVEEVKKQEPAKQEVEVVVTPKQVFNMLCSLVAEGQYPDKKWKDINEIMVLAQQNTISLKTYIDNNETPYCLKSGPAAVDNTSKSGHKEPSTKSK